jgi:isoquinoline 1-oxidoreductase beta subunit
MSTHSLQKTNEANGWTRRNFLITTVGGFGGLCLGFSLPKLGILDDAQAATPSPVQINAYIQISSDNHITMLFGGCEFGQGTMTGFCQIVAEELKVKPYQIDASQADGSIDPVTGKGVSYPIVADPCTLTPVNILYGTGGSGATRGRYTTLRMAAATAREMLIGAGAAALGYSPSQCSAVDGTVVVNGTSLSKTYGELAGAAAKYCPTTPVSLSADAAAFQVIGQRIARVDIPQKTDGSAKYGLDIRLPGMLYAVIKHCPTIGGTLTKTPSTPSGAKFVFPIQAGVTRGAVVQGAINAVAVVGDNTWYAWQGARSIRATWNIPASSANIDSQVILAQAQSLMSTGPALIAEQDGNPDNILNSAINKIDSTYYLPYIPHVCMEVLNCTVKYTGAACEIWAPTQSASGVATTAKALTGLNGDKIIVHTTLLGGGLGRKIEQDYISQAVQVAMALYQKTGSGTVKLMWPREEDLTNDNYRPMALVHVQLGSLNGAVAMKYRTVTPSIRQQRQTNPQAPLTAADSNSVDGAAGSIYGFSSRLVEQVVHPAGVPIGFWRSVGFSINSFVLESAIDELATANGNSDPLAFRQELLAATIANASDPKKAAKAARALAVVNAAASISPWRNSLPAGHAWGIAYAESFGSLVCEIVDISQPVAGALRVNRVACAVDCGIAINPGSVEAQMQGGIVHGLSSALWGQQIFVKGQATIKNFNAFRVLRASEMPQVEVKIVPSDMQFIGGIGETAVPPIGPAVANAYFQLTGQRIKSLPFFPNAGGYGGG